ncbi:hypothetical protein M2371_000763 [Buttiauxella sp. BIGb0471]|uniref:Uncharacterized protein n=1 Tax=Buttiauxella agrestis TaxID=82977 RepID=A0A381C6Y5_9ENTR|nr:hypothetical protein [Buttiauxella sp. BIGb0471]SUW63582.1 Uncharacterised protein [Buttiauxella agrestis]
MVTVQEWEKQNQRNQLLASHCIMLMNRTHRTMKEVHP